MLTTSGLLTAFFFMVLVIIAAALRMSNSKKKIKQLDGEIEHLRDALVELTKKSGTQYPHARPLLRNGDYRPNASGALRAGPHNVD